jgi:uncharacterized protein YkwD
MLQVSVLAALALAGLAASNGGTAVARHAVAGAQDAQAAVELIAQMNEARARLGLSPLHETRDLDRAAASHAADMAAYGFFEHEGRDGKPFWVRLERFYPPTPSRSWLVGENLMWRSPSFAPSDAVEAWLVSKPHRRNLLDPHWRDVGVAVLDVSRAPGVYGELPTTIVVADFGAR